MKDLIFALIHPFLKLYIRLRFHDYWALKKHLRAHPGKLLRLAYDHYFMDMGSFVGVNSQIEGVPCFPHGCRGVYISDQAVIGEGAVIFQQVTIGSNSLPDSKGQGAPVIGRDCYIGAGAKIIGGVVVGDHCRIGANAVVYKDLPDNAVAVCAPTRVIQKEHLDNTFHTVIGGKHYIDRDGRLVPER